MELVLLRELLNKALNSIRQLRNTVFLLLLCTICTKHNVTNQNCLLRCDQEIFLPMIIRVDAFYMRDENRYRHCCLELQTSQFEVNFLNLCTW